MRSLALAVVIFAGILAYGSAAPQLTPGDLAWLENILRGLASQNSTVRFGNNTLIVSGVSSASANVNPSPVEPHRPHYPGNWVNWGPGYGGYWRMVPSVDGEIVEELEHNNAYDANDFAFDLNEDETVEDIIEEDVSDEDHSFSDASSAEAEDELDEEADEEEDEAEDEEGSDQEDVNESLDEEVDPEEEAADKELDETESELPAEKTN